LSLTADSKRNLLLLLSLTQAGLREAGDAEKIIAERPELLRTLPAFYAIQASGPCPQACTLCPYPRISSRDVRERRDFLDCRRFEDLLDRILEFSGDAVIDLSLWGEIALHPQKMELIQLVLARKNLSLIIETSGLGWTPGEFEALAALSAPGRPFPWTAPPAALSWIVSLDSADPAGYGELRGEGYAPAVEAAKTLVRYFPRDTHVQAVRVQGREDETEGFYRSWKDAGAQVIIQKYDHFCGFLPEKKAADLSPLTRQPCWHLMRDMNILIDGRVPRCREDLAALREPAEGRVLGNAFEEALETIWNRGGDPYREHCSRRYTGICAECDEYYTFNF
jgi:spiro-SPASM protein